MTAKTTAQKSAALFATTLLLVTKGRADDGADEIGHDVKQWCHELEYLDEISQQLVAEVERRVMAIAANKDTASIWRLAQAVTADSREQAGYAALVLYAEHHQETALAKLKLLQQEISRLKPHINRRIQVIRSAEFITRLFKRQISATATHTAVAATCSVKPTLASETSYTCELSPGRKAATATVRQKLATATKIKLGDLSKLENLLETPVIAIGSSPSVNVFATSQKGDGKCSTTASGAPAITGGTNHITVAYAEATLKQMSTTTKAIKPGTTAQPSGGAEKLTTNWLKTDYITEGLANLKPLYASKPLDLSNLKVTDLKSDLGRRLVTNLQGKEGAGSKMSDSKDTEAADKLINSLYGADDSNFADNFINSLKNKPVKYKKDGEEQTTDIGKLATNPDLELALSYLEGMKRIRKLEGTAEKKDVAKKTETEEKTGEKKDGDNKTNATDCTGAEEGKCDKTKCDWNAEKKQCKVKEGAAVISYVMKAPLLLALLLS
uniref:Variant surface glycoprotein n=1 Tax=Trypanosoma brucei TaxID=5691 RepID=A0A1V0FXZ0_9TRYP|nr:variant surface glycoprotein [Trypanosoma brucei]